MVRVNIISPKKLADQHLVAEYNEILMLLGYVRKYPLRKNIPLRYLLGPGHIRFFKDKLVYLRDRHELLKKEMRKRGYAPAKTIDLREFPSELHNSWKPHPDDFLIIKERIAWKIKKKPSYYRYYGEKKSVKFFIELLD